MRLRWNQVDPEFMAAAGTGSQRDAGPNCAHVLAIFYHKRKKDKKAQAGVGGRPGLGDQSSGVSHHVTRAAPPVSDGRARPWATFQEHTQPKIVPAARKEQKANSFLSGHRVSQRQNRGQALGLGGECFQGKEQQEPGARGQPLCEAVQSDHGRRASRPRSPCAWHPALCPRADQVMRFS